MKSPATATHTWGHHIWTHDDTIGGGTHWKSNVAMPCPMGTTLSALCTIGDTMRPCHFPWDPPTSFGRSHQIRQIPDPRTFGRRSAGIPGNMDHRSPPRKYMRAGTTYALQIPTYAPQIPTYAPPFPPLKCKTTVPTYAPQIPIYAPPIPSYAPQNAF